jgi:hypothetical protein
VPRVYLFEASQHDLDADERLSPSLAAEHDSKILRNMSNYTNAHILYLDSWARTFYCGAAVYIIHGSVPLIDLESDRTMWTIVMSSNTIGPFTFSKKDVVHPRCRSLYDRERL